MYKNCSYRLGFNQSSVIEVKVTMFISSISVLKVSTVTTIISIGFHIIQLQRKKYPPKWTKIYFKKWIKKYTLNASLSLCKLLVSQPFLVLIVSTLLEFFVI